MEMMVIQMETFGNIQFSTLITLTLGGKLISKILMILTQLRFGIDWIAVQKDLLTLESSFSMLIVILRMKKVLLLEIVKNHGPIRMLMLKDNSYVFLCQE